MDGIARVRAGGVRRLSVLFLALGHLTASVASQDAPGRPTQLVNGDMEAVDARGELVGWYLPAALRTAGHEIGPESDVVFEGSRAAAIDSRRASGDANSFGNLMQSIDATPWRGKRVRLRAAVQVSEAGAEGQAQMWLRVDRPAAGASFRMGFFDNMDDRPIRSSEWSTHEIVGDVAEDATGIALGVLTRGSCLVRVDAVTLEEVGATVASTRAIEADAPPQPFWTPWLALPLVALALFALGFLGGGRLGAFALRFTGLYWGLYTLSTMLALVPFLGNDWSAALQAGPVDALVRWTARTCLGIEGELVSALRNGSGDTTYSYVEALITFVLALGAAIAWSLIDRRERGLAGARDLLRSLLRYYLAIQMTAYGLAKLTALYNQFPTPGIWRLDQAYGESSPMGLLWTFMGSSQAYTRFGGAMELVGALLLVWRRTALLGALVSLSVLANVMLLNFCYDVPVKLFSTHLVVAAGCIALPDARRLARFFLLGKAVAAPTRRVLEHRGLRWGHRLVKAALVVSVLVLPLGRFAFQEVAASSVLPLAGEWTLTSLELDGQDVTPAAGELEALSLFRPLEREDDWRLTGTLRRVGQTTVTQVAASADATRLTLEGTPEGSGRLVSGEFRWTREGDALQLEGNGARAVLEPATHEYLLVRRGFRWINERPFNR